MRAYTHARDWCRVSRERRAGLHIEDAQEFAGHMRACAEREIDAIVRLIRAAGLVPLAGIQGAVLRVRGDYY